MKKTLIIGASDNPERYSYKALQMLLDHKHEVVAIGRKEMEVLGVPVHKDLFLFEGVDTVTLYVSAKNQEAYYDYIINIKPRRVIFNPGTENPYFYTLLQQKHIAYEEACTLVLLTTGQF